MLSFFGQIDTTSILSVFKKTIYGDFMFNFKSVFIFAALIAGSSSCLAWSKKDPQAEQAAAAQAFVDAKMAHAISSLDASMGTLVTMSRGGSAAVARAPGPIGETAAGAAQAQVSTTRQSSASPSQSPAASPLDKKIDIQWNGSAQELLASLSKKIGYTFVEKGSPQKVNVKILARQVSVRQLLEMTAMQLNGTSDIHVSSSRSEISLTANK